MCPRRHAQRAGSAGGSAGGQADRGRFGQQEASYTTRLSDCTIAPFVGPFPLSVAPDGSRFLVHDFNLIHIRGPGGTPLATIPVGSGTI